MKDSLSKEHYFEKIITLLMKSSAYPPPSIDTHLCVFPSCFYRKILMPSSMIFQKSQAQENLQGFFSKSVKNPKIFSEEIFFLVCTHIFKTRNNIIC